MRKNDGTVLFLDGVRGVAAVLVVTQHVGYMDDVNLGECAVDMFFVLSSFLFTWLFYKKSEQLLTQQASVYPLFAIVATIVYLLPPEAQKLFFKVRDPGKTKYELLKVLTFDFKSQHHVFWTLSLEVVYYFLIPFISMAAINLGRVWWVPCLPLYCWIGYSGWTEFKRDHQELRPHLLTFVCGSLAAILYVKIKAAIKHQSPAFKFAKLHVFMFRGVEIATFGLLLSILCQGLVFHWFLDHPRQVDEGEHFISLYLTVLIVIKILLPSALSTALEWNVLRHWGKIGFSVYLLHSFVIYAEPIRSQENYYDKLVSQFFLIHVLATVSFHLIEVPCQKMAARISRALIRVAGKDRPGRARVLYQSKSD